MRCQSYDANARPKSCGQSLRNACSHPRRDHRFISTFIECDQTVLFRNSKIRKFASPTCQHQRSTLFCRHDLCVRKKWRMVIALDQFWQRWMKEFVPYFKNPTQMVETAVKSPSRRCHLLHLNRKTQEEPGHRDHSRRFVQERVGLSARFSSASLTRRLNFASSSPPRWKIQGEKPGCVQGRQWSGVKFAMFVLPPFPNSVEFIVLLATSPPAEGDGRGRKEFRRQEGKWKVCWWFAVEYLVIKRIVHLKVVV